MPHWPQGSNNSILVSGVPHEMSFVANETQTWPGMGVNVDPAGGSIADRCDAGENVTCIVDISQASVTGRGVWRADSIFGWTLAGSTDRPLDQGDTFKCIRGPVNVMLLLSVSVTVNQGDKLMCVGGGRFGPYTCGSTADPCALVAEALETITTSSLQAAVYIHAKLLI